MQNAEPVTVQANNMTARVKDDFRPNLMKIILFRYFYFYFLNLIYLSAINPKGIGPKKLPAMKAMLG